MEDKDIIKALECCLKSVPSCSKCPYHIRNNECFNELRRNALNLINRQQEKIDSLVEQLAEVCI